MTRLVLKRASTSRPSGQWKDEDYDVLADGQVVGRILESGSPDLHRHWAGVACDPQHPAGQKHHAAR